MEVIALRQVTSRRPEESLPSLRSASIRCRSNLNLLLSRYNLKQIPNPARKSTLMLLLIINVGLQPSDQLSDRIPMPTDKFLVMAAALIGSSALAQFLGQPAEDPFLPPRGFVGEMSHVFFEEGDVGYILSAVPVALAEAVAIDGQFQLLHGVVFWLVVIVLLALLVPLHFPLPTHLLLPHRLLALRRTVGPDIAALHPLESKYYIISQIPHYKNHNPTLFGAQIPPDTNTTPPNPPP